MNGTDRGVSTRRAHRAPCRILTAPAAVAVFGILVACARLEAQSFRGGPSFEVASIEPSASGGRIGMTFTPGRFTAVNAPLDRLIYLAYQMPPFRVVGAPDWVSTERFDVAAKAADAAAPPTRLQMLDMLRALLDERFSLGTHLERRELPVYALQPEHEDGHFGKSFRPSVASAEDCGASRADGDRSPAGSPPDGPHCGVRGRAGYGRDYSFFILMMGRMSMAEIADQLALSVSRPVVDETGLEGLFDLDLEFTPEGLLNVPPPPPGSHTSPPIFTAIREQAGLRLVAGSAPVEVLVIDEVRRPTPD